MAQALRLFQTLAVLKDKEGRQAVNSIHFDGFRRTPEITVVGSLLDTPQEVFAGINQWLVPVDEKSDLRWQLRVDFDGEVMPSTEAYPKWISDEVLGQILDHFSEIKPTANEENPEETILDWELQQDPTSELVDFIRVTQGLPFTVLDFKCAVRQDQLANCHLKVAVPTERHLS